MSDLLKTLEERAVSYDQSGPSAQHTAILLREAAVEIARLREALSKLTDPMLLDVEGIGIKRMIMTINVMRDIAKAALDPEPR